MFRVAICDDDPIICAQLEEIILDYERKIYQKIETDVYFSGEEFYRHLKKGIYYDMVFLDINLRKLDGIQLGMSIRNELKNEMILIVYISGDDSYAMDLFEVRPLHYLVKPLEAEKVLTVLKKGMELSNKLCLAFQYKQNYENKSIPAVSILYFESLGRKVKMVTIEGEEIFYGSLADIFSQLRKSRFFFCHKSYLVNYYHVAKFQYEQLMMRNGAILPISQTKRKSIRTMQMEIEKKGSR
ncbi:response regulator transcription factor [Anoxybacterium hadale]|uniref:Response regulator transcription factor n=1 Tax=Anoxybacterium hadale TaxID=3408580 RepID=A0ACD1A7H4_9FIRM|nr:response regulator transcription factor [Clostridiales bacterium]